MQTPIQTRVAKQSEPDVPGRVAVSGEPQSKIREDDRFGEQ